MTADVVQVVEHLLCKCEVLFKPCPTKKKKKKPKTQWINLTSEQMQRRRVNKNTQSTKRNATRKLKLRTSEGLTHI
jgi:hypothetical protein